MIDIETFYTYVFYVFTGAIGLCVGSFLNVVIYRVPLKMSVAKPSSHCPNCKEPIKWYDNIPVISYTILRGRCRNCKVHIPFRYTAVEIANTVAWLLCIWRFYGEDVKSAVFSVIAMILSSVLLCVFFIDIENQIIPDRFHIIIGILAVLSVLFTDSPYGGTEHILSHIIGAAVGFLSFYLIGLVMSKALGKEALGGGDIKFSLVMGLFLGWQRWLLAVLISSLCASILLIILGKFSEKDKEYPFGPFLASAFFITVFFGDWVIDWYLSLLIN